MRFIEMKQPFIYIFLLISGSLWANTSVFDEANKAYLDGNYPEAIEKYEGLVAGGYASANLYLNLGNSFYQTGELGKSILFFERALRFKPGNHIIYSNLLIAREATEDQIAYLPHLIFVTKWHQFLALFTASNWAKLLLVFVWISVLSFLFKTLLKEDKKKRLFNFLGIIGIFLSLAVALFTFSKNKLETCEKHAIIMVDATLLLEGPDEDAKTVMQLHEGTKIDILSTSDSWSKVRIDASTMGWMKHSDFIVI